MRTNPRAKHSCILQAHRTRCLPEHCRRARCQGLPSHRVIGNSNHQLHRPEWNHLCLVLSGPNCAEPEFPKDCGNRPALPQCHDPPCDRSDHIVACRKQPARQQHTQRVNLCGVCQPNGTAEAAFMTQDDDCKALLLSVFSKPCSPAITDTPRIHMALATMKN